MATHSLIYEVQPPERPRNRLTNAFRIILAIPHLLLVGGPGIGWGMNSSTGALGGVASVQAAGHRRPLLHSRRDSCDLIVTGAEKSLN
jgi:hypothetical protein